MRGPEEKAGVRPRGAIPTFVRVAVAVLSSATALGAQVGGNPNPHGPLPAGLDCSACHTTAGWLPTGPMSDFEHEAHSTFALDGVHGELECASCHLDLRFDEPRVSPGECGSCHADIHLGQLGRDCRACHTTRSFVDLPEAELHASTAFPLTGAHAQISCESCHQDDTGGAFSPLDVQCMSCHRDAWRVATLDHQAAGFPTDCAQCHDDLAWSSVPAFDHAAASGGYALVESHARLRCSGCHVGSGFETRFAPAGSEDCVACHRVDYQAKHGSRGYPEACLTCHRQSGWDADFEHGRSAGFPLLGAHEAAACSACHIPPGADVRFPASGVEDCVACHQPDYDREHAGSGFSTDCAACHTVNGWEAADFDHASTGFPLLGSHEPLPCASCHLEGSNALVFDPTGPQDCVTCHQADYDREHAGSGFATDCAACHTVNGWEGADFDHVAAADFALIQPHDALPCTGCHVPGGSELLFGSPADEDDCVVCHREDYQREHATDGFPSTCLDCHQRTTWSGARFDHDRLFPIYSGEHRGTWSTCATCHTDPPDYGVFTCLTCHAHRQARMDDAHDEEGGYTYESQACLSCHPRGDD